jgi:hypothetical protein
VRVFIDWLVETVAPRLEGGGAVSPNALPRIRLNKREAEQTSS